MVCASIANAPPCLANNHTFVNIKTCNDDSGSWCCDYGPDPTTCCNTKWLPVLGTVVANTVESVSISTVVSTSTIPAATSTITVYSTETSFASPSNNSVAVGAGVGVPLGVIAIIASSYAVWLHRKERAIGAPGKAPSGRLKSAELGGKEYLGGAGKVGPVYAPHELESQEVYEAPGANRRR
jgi:hypothetical protein